MKLTCVTATYNCIKAGNLDRLIRCVESVARLKTEHEHLIYDGASTDGTVNLLRELEAKISGLTVVSEPDTGIYNALNKGVRDAQGEWFYVLGADDYISHPDVMDAIIADEVGDTQIIITPVETETYEGKPSTIRFSNMKELKWFLNGCVCCHQGELMKTSLTRELGAEVGYVGFDERYKVSADTDMFIKAHLRAVPIHYIFRSFACFHWGGFADSNMEAFRREDFASVVRALHLNEKQAEYFARKNFLPPSVAMRLAFHRDVAVRIAARAMLVLRIKDFFRPFLRPLIAFVRDKYRK